ncbi:HAMP domain-containing protein [Streptomyces sp. SRF1]|uniref:sensor histidine kinase n=1 Tax=Streptomyces sp. SRF1 TaxID=1549642 RepID=UPI0025B085EE|nr:ATP-binding protein [Streptomyces sp. SRF1]MDN3058408.1 HAMP domain-containing protein [Streptomyces sp. SRF1]
MSVDTADPPLEQDPSGRAPLRPRSRRAVGAPGALLDRWPFRRKLNVLVIVPLTVVGVLLGLAVHSEVQQARDAARTARLVRDSGQVARLINDIQAEHRQALLLSVLQDAVRPGATLPSTADYRRAQRSTDERATAVRSAFGADLPKEEARALDYVQRLSVLRDKVERGSVPAAGIDPAYAAAVGYLIDGIGLDHFSGSPSSSAVELVDTVLRADAAHAAFEGGVFSAQTRDANALTEYTRAVGAHRVFEEQSERFARIADPDQVLRLDGIERHAEENGFEDRFAQLKIDPSSLQGQSTRELRTAMAAGTRQAGARLEITRSLIDQIADRADGLSQDALHKALALLALAVLGFAAWLGFSILVRRSVVRPLAALTGAAHQVVEVAGEELAKVEDDDATDSTPLRPRPIPVPVRDEIGALAEAFNQVQVTAAALLERQVLSRRNVGEMFGNVGRRVSNLTTRQLSLIDAVEREETDPGLLERLYRIDHIAVRLQRNADSLMLLAGIRETELDARPTSLANVIRAALGQIEGYQRVSLRAETEVTVAPDITGDLTLMLAELLENAVEFSPSDTPVEVVVRPGTDVSAEGGALVEVIDHGLGMGAERLAEENARLVRRERLDLVPTKVLGLFVVGSLARRWGVRITLSRTPGGGVTGSVWIPAPLLLELSPLEKPAPAPGSSSGSDSGSGSGSDSGSGSGPGSGSGSGSGSVMGPVAASGSGSGSGPVVASGSGSGSASAERPAGSGPESGAPAPAATPLPVLASTTAPERHPAAPTTGTGLPRRLPTGARTSTESARKGAESARKNADSARTGAEPVRTPHEPSAEKNPDAAHEPNVAKAHEPGAGKVPNAPSAGTAAPASRPLRRRVRGATLDKTTSPADRAIPAVRGPVDADAVRSELDAFEAAVRRAEQDSAATQAEPTPSTHQRPRKESGSDHADR